MGLPDLIAAAIRGEGPIAFEHFVELALYEPDFGFYARAGEAGGRRGDFITSVEVGPLFGAVIGDWLDRRWREAGSPDPFRVTEVGAGVGTLYRSLRRAAPACLPALEYALVERSERLRAVHADLPGDRWRSAAALPDERQHVIVANELLDNLPFGIAERVEGGWAPLLVTHDGGDFALAAGEGRLDLATDAPVGSRVPVASGAVAWLAHARSVAQRVLVFDYGATTAELAARGIAGWLRTYRGHERGSDPFDAIGECDITHDVPFDQLPEPATASSQAAWLRANGIDARVEAGKRLWRERAHIGDLEAIVARSAVNEAAALVDPAGLGAFHVLEWEGRRAGIGQPAAEMR